MALVGNNFGCHFGDIDYFDWATSWIGALQALVHFIEYALLRFGDEQDPMLESDPILSHSFFSPYMDIGLLSPKEVCNAVETSDKAGKIPLNSVEGDIRKMIG
ncbi:MAG: hypothetical protein QMC17_05825 [Paracoccaceae bacterium]|jgi:deoxyribodipyrimidine photolyase-related protein